MSKLLNDLQTGKHKKLFQSNTEFAVYSTGFNTLDSINAFRMNYVDENGEIKSEMVKGIIGGRFITIIGSSGTGKSTLADQIAWNIVKDFDEGLAIHVDVEQTVLEQRLRDVIGAPIGTPGYEKFIINKENTYVEDILVMIDDICNVKEANKDETTYETTGKWFGKKKITLYQPTVIIVDSLPSFTSKDIDTTSISGQMSTNREVAIVAQFYTKLLPKIAKYNITVIATNHIRPKIVVDMYNPAPPQLMLLRQSETMPRGQAPVFYASTILRLNASGKSALLAKEDYGFEGFKCVAQAAKSKTSFIGGTTSLIFTEDHGFDNEYTLLLTLYDNSLVLGKNYKDKDGLYVKMEDADIKALGLDPINYKFSKSNFGIKYKNIPEFKAIVDKALTPIFDKLLEERDSAIKKIDSIEDHDTYMITDANGNMVPNKITETDQGTLKKLPEIENKDIMHFEDGSPAIINPDNANLAIA